MPLSRKFTTLRELKRRPDGQVYSLSEIAREASRLYREERIRRATDELHADGVGPDEIERVSDQIRSEPDVVTRLYLTELRDGKKKDVKWTVVEALSLFFNVKTDFWRIGDDATDLTRALEQEVELITLGMEVVKAAQALNKSTESKDGETQGMELIGILLRGSQEKDPAQAESILRLAAMALRAAPKAGTG